MFSIHPFKGSLFENMMIAEYVKRMYHQNQVVDLWFWRDSAGHEVEFTHKWSDYVEFSWIQSNPNCYDWLIQGIKLFGTHKQDAK